MRWPWTHCSHLCEPNMTTHLLTLIVYYRRFSYRNCYVTTAHQQCKCHDYIHQHWISITMCISPLLRLDMTVTMFCCVLKVEIFLFMDRVIMKSNRDWDIVAVCFKTFRISKHVELCLNWVNLHITLLTSCRFCQLWKLLNIQHTNVLRESLHRLLCSFSVVRLSTGKPDELFNTGLKTKENIGELQKDFYFV